MHSLVRLSLLASTILLSGSALAVTDALTVQPGIRVNYDKKVGGYQRLVFDGQGNPVLFTDPLTGLPITDIRTAAR